MTDVELLAMGAWALAAVGLLLVYQLRSATRALANR